MFPSPFESLPSPSESLPTPSEALPTSFQVGPWEGGNHGRGEGGQMDGHHVPVQIRNDTYVAQMAPQKMAQRWCKVVQIEAKVVDWEKNFRLGDNVVSWLKTFPLSKKKRELTPLWHNVAKIDIKTG